MVQSLCHVENERCAFLGLKLVKVLLLGGLQRAPGISIELPVSSVILQEVWFFFPSTYIAVVTF